MLNMDFNDLKLAKQKAKENTGKNENKAEISFNEGLKLLDEFHSNSDKKYLEKAGDKFIETISFKRTMVEPYVYLAYIYYLLNEDKEALQYLKIAEEIDKNYSKINELKKMLTKNYSGK
jgi:tetratricopeptide (TPR) repeat protein